ncbi:malto-oligosyltrehalose trehalohydrolase [Knoellia sp. 3-2P3]|uniref:malto-oligosyltrehalose trehalohydrolase n=1 Tax=unclassified Knoellia TaxID=2618719 RepID=UPI0023DC23B2|nr:malto-oligosyltrehalose trehalohydrolase [Knoellia sp. 3-2P3]MDF2092900.1 malto-oligosyltrehalose trehalohydrolase [Knoellia sp. 3-2P3]
MSTEQRGSRTTTAGRGRPTGQASRSHELRVWVPDAQRVAVHVGSPDEDPAVQSMTAAGGGWWAWRTTAASGPLDYAFSVDGGEPRPDPRSAWQPHGVHGPSRTFDTGAHEWADSTWAGPQQGLGTLGGVVYELHVGTFTPEGTLDSAVGRLDHLVDLGVDVVELMPVAAFDGRWNWGYDGVAPYAVHEDYGGPAALQRFVDACHQRGLGVCLDVVYNHLGPAGNYLGTFGPYFTEAHATPWGAALNLDQEGSHEVRRWIIDNALRWFGEFRVDALRLDAVHELRDDSDRHVLAQLADEVKALEHRLGRPLTLIAESDLNDPAMVTPTSEGGRGMDAQWDDDVHHALHVSLTGERQGYYADFGGFSPPLPDGGPLTVLAKTLTQVFLHDGRYSSFRESEWGAPVDRAAVDGRRFLAYLQTHDQVGNRAVGDRISAITSPGQQAVGAALYLTAPYTPMLFMGEEWAASTPFQFFTDFGDAELREAVSEGRRSEFESHGWAFDDVPDPQDEATYRGSQLDWAEAREHGHARMLGWYRDLIALRRSEADLGDGRLDRVEVACHDDNQWLVMRRGGVGTVANLNDAEQTVPVPAGIRSVLLAWDPAATAVDGEGLRLPGHGVAVVRLRQGAESTG